MHKHSIVVDDFGPNATELRRAFDARIGDNLRSSPAAEERFVWDYWHVPDQFTYMRTSADKFFERALISAFHVSLQDWALAELGVSQIRGSWLSYYVDGGEQRIHADGPNGGWAYVYSLTNWGTHRFSGGETFMRRAGVGGKVRVPSDDSPLGDSFETHEPRFGRLIVFNSQVEHGVTTVRGTRNPLDGRVVLHGWLGAGPFQLRGALTREAIRALMEEAFDGLEQLLADFDGTGTASARLDIGPDGAVRGVRFLSNTIALVGGGASGPLLEKAGEYLSHLRFPRATDSSSLTLPLAVS